MNRLWLVPLVVLLMIQTSRADDPPPAAQRRDPSAAEKKPQPEAEKIDFERARQLFRKKQSGGKLSADEEAYLQRALEARRKARGGRARGGDPRSLPPGEKTGLKPLNEMSADDRYLEQDGGLYGQGMNEPPQQHRQAAERELAKVQPLNTAGEGDADGKMVLVSISMSNATQEFSRFKQIADRDPDKSPRLTIVDCAQGGQAMAEWVDPDARPWAEAARRLQRAGVSPAQVQVAWIKLANKGPRGDLQAHGRKLQRDTQAVIQNAKAKFPNLRIAYLSGRIYGGYSGGGAQSRTVRLRVGVCRTLADSGPNGRQDSQSALAALGPLSLGRRPHAAQERRSGLETRRPGRRRDASFAVGPRQSRRHAAVVL